MAKIYHRDDGVKEPIICAESLSTNSWTHEIFNTFCEHFCGGCIEPICLASFILPEIDPDNPYNAKFGVYCPKWTNEIEGTNDGYLNSAMYTKNNIFNHKEIEE